MRCVFDLLLFKGYIGRSITCCYFPVQIDISRESMKWMQIQATYRKHSSSCPNKFVFTLSLFHLAEIKKNNCPFSFFFIVITGDFPCLIRNSRSYQLVKYIFSYYIFHFWPTIQTLWIKLFRMSDSLFLYRVCRKCCRQLKTY